MAETQAPSYLQQYLNEMKANQPDLDAVRQRVTQAVGNTQVAALNAEIKRAQQIANGITAPPPPRTLIGHYYGGGGIGQPGGEPIYDTPAQARSKNEGDLERNLGQSIVESFRGQVDAAQRQGENQGAALQTKADASLGYIENLRSQATQAVAGATESIAVWNRYTETADQYLQDSAARMVAVTQDIKGTIDKYAATNDSALAHSIQSSSHTWLQTNKAQERSIAERYGMESPEYRDWQDAKRASIGAMVSDLTSQAWDKTQTILNTGLGAVAGAEVQLAEHVNLAQKNSLDALEASAAAGDQYRLQTSSYLFSLAAAENTEWAELADWIDKSPVTAIDTAPMFAQLLDIQQGMDAQAKADAMAASGKAMA